MVKIDGLSVASVSDRRGGKGKGRRRRLVIKAATEKEQSAIEYLITYGWALLIIAIVLGILFQLGIFNSALFGPRAPPGSCRVFRTTAGTQLEGICSGLLPEYVASLSGQNQAGGNPNNKGGGVSCINSTVATTNLAQGGYNTVSFWMDWSGKLNESPVGFPGYFLWLSTNDCVGFTTGNKDAYGVNASGLGNNWNMVTIEFFNGPYTLNSTLYINGVQQNLYQCLPNAHTGFAKALLLIGSSTGSKYRFDGQLADMQEYNTSLDNASVKALFAEGPGGAPISLTTLTAWYPLNGDTNDYSGNQNPLNFAACSYSYLGAYNPPP